MKILTQILRCEALLAWRDVSAVMPAALCSPLIIAKFIKMWHNWHPGCQNVNTDNPGLVRASVNSCPDCDADWHHHVTPDARAGEQTGIILVPFCWGWKQKWKSVSSGSGGGAVQYQDCHFSQYFIQSQGETLGLIALLIGSSPTLWPLIGQGCVAHLYHWLTRYHTEQEPW